MKLRVKRLGQHALFRIEVDAGATFAELQTLVMTAMQPNCAWTPRLSLNKKDELVQEAHAPVMSLGLCSGDTLWVMNSPGVESSQVPVGAANGPVSTGASVRAAAAAAPPTVAPAPVATAPADRLTPAAAFTTAASQQQQPQQPEPEPEPLLTSACDSMDVDGDGEAVSVLDGGNSSQHPCVPNLLRRTLAMSAVPLTPHGLLVCALHAVMQEAGFESSTQHPLQSTGRGSYSLVYMLHPPACMQQPTTAGTETAARSSSGDRSTSVAAVMEPRSCSIKCVELGRFLIAHAATGSGSTAALVTSLNLSVPLHVETVDVATGADAAVSSATDGTTPANSLASASAIAGAKSAPSGDSSHRLRLKDISQLWRTLKDQLALPLMSALSQQAGWPERYGLDTLPFELQEAILQLLPARNLAALACCSTQMRRIASLDTLWRQLYMQEFPNQPRSDLIEAERCGWKWAFGSSWVERRRRQERARRRQVFPMPVPFPGPLPGGPLPMRSPHPHIIGGDYDRFPSFGPSQGVFFGPPMGLGSGSFMLDPHQQQQRQELQSPFNGDPLLAAPRQLQPPGFGSSMGGGAAGFPGVMPGAGRRAGRLDGFRLY